jgi:hypothetical protein
LLICSNSKFFGVLLKNSWKDRLNPFLELFLIDYQK